MIWYNANMILRVGFNLFIFLSILFLPWQSYALFLLAGFFLYDNYYEGIAWGVFLDTVSGGVGGMVYWYTVYVVLLYIAVWYLKPLIRFYD